MTKTLTPLRTAALAGTAMLFTMCAHGAPEEPEELGSVTQALGWSAPPSLAQARGQHATALLPDGRLLVVGGVNSTGFVTSAELFDLASGTWLTVGSPGITGNVAAGLVLPNGKVFFHTDNGNSVIFSPRSNTWSAGPSIPGRGLATFTLLRSGQVLIAGGGNEASAVLYAPETNTVSPTGSMAVARRAAGAVLLRDGRVLVVSGFSNATGEVPSAELYNPNTGTWALAAPPLVPRHYASATLLPDGRVLLAGGYASSGVTTHTELYDPAANTWTATGALTYPRNGHTATLLPSGKLLVVGGADGARNTQPVAELYDPATGIWSTAGTQAVGTENHTATLLPTGRVLVAGGFSQTSSLTFHARAELFEPSAERWVPAGNLAQGRGATAVLLPSGQVLVAGGRGASGVLGSAERYTRASNTWAPAASLTTARERATLTVLRSGEVLAVGGSNGSAALASAERYDPATDTWQAAGTLMHARDGHSATLLASGKVLVSGGGSGVSEVYDPASGAWTSGATLATPRARHASVLLADGRVLVAGGENSGAPLASAELYDPFSGTWAPAASLSQARSAFTLSLLPSGQVLATGGTSLAAELASAELYDPLTNTWSAVGTLAGPRALHSAVVLPSGLVLVAGGQGPGGTVLASAELYDPVTRSWSSASGLAAQRLRYALALLPSGEVLAVGGQGAGGAFLASSELFELTGAQPAWRPSVTSATLLRGCAGEVRGTGFRGISQASYGSTMSSPTDYPIVRLTAAEGGRVQPLLSRDWSSTSATIDVPGDVAPGNYLLSVFANAIPGGALVQVKDNTPPVADGRELSTAYDVPLEIELAASDAEEEALSLEIFTPPAHGTLSNLQDGRITYSPDPGFLGVDSFVFRARDCGLHSDPATIEISVVDDTPPSVSCPGDIVVDVDGESSVVTWAAPTASDEISESPSIVSSHESGSAFPLGTTTVTVTATDDAGNHASCTFDVTVSDTEAPSLACPADVMLQAADDAGAVARWSPATADGATSVVYSNKSGSKFPVGTTTVTVSASDAAGNSSSCTFDVTVTERPAPEPEPMPEPEPKPEPEPEPEPEPGDKLGGVSSGGRCSVSHGPARGGLSGLLLVGLALVAVRRRRRN